MFILLMVMVSNPFLSQWCGIRKRYSTTELRTQQRDTQVYFFVLYHANLIIIEQFAVLVQG